MGARRNRLTSVVLGAVVAVLVGTTGCALDGAPGASPAPIPARSVVPPPVDTTGAPGGGARLVFEPPNMTFAPHPEGTASAPQHVVMRNTGDAPLRVHGVLATPQPAEFLDHGLCKYLEPGASCQASVVFRPRTSGPVVGQLTVQSDGADGVATLVLTGTGLERKPHLVIEPPTLAFGGQEVGTSSAPRTVLLRNTGRSALRVHGVLVGPQPAVFLDSGLCKYLEAGAWCSTSVAFRPRVPGPIVGELAVHSNADNPIATLGLSGDGSAASQPRGMARVPGR